MPNLEPHSENNPAHPVTEHTDASFTALEAARNDSAIGDLVITPGFAVRALGAVENLPEVGNEPENRLGSNGLITTGVADLNRYGYESNPDVLRPESNTGDHAIPVAVWRPAYNWDLQAAACFTGRGTHLDLEAIQNIGYGYIPNRAERVPVACCRNRRFNNKRMEFITQRHCN